MSFFLHWNHTNNCVSMGKKAKIEKCFWPYLGLYKRNITEYFVKIINWTIWIMLCKRTPTRQRHLRIFDINLHAFKGFLNFTFAWKQFRKYVWWHLFILLEKVFNEDTSSRSAVKTIRKHRLLLIRYFL